MASPSLLALAACNDLAGFESYLKNNLSSSIDDVHGWQGKHHTPLMVAAAHGSLDVLEHILTLSSAADVNRRCGSSKASALHCVASSSTPNALEAAKALLVAGADPDLKDAFGRRPVDLVFAAPSEIREELKEILNCRSVHIKHDDATDEFWMYSFKVRSCSKMYSHDWLECSYAHPYEHGRRRDPRKYSYSSQPCPDFKDGSCPRGDGCDHAHGVFERWLHPAMFRTRMCRDREICPRKVCFFAHSKAELRGLPSATARAASDGKQRADGTHDPHHNRDVRPGFASKYFESTLDLPLNIDEDDLLPHVLQKKQQVQNSRFIMINPSVCFDCSHLSRTSAVRPTFHVLLNLPTQSHHHHDHCQQQSDNVIDDDPEIFDAYLDHCSFPKTTSMMPTVDHSINPDHNVLISQIHNQWQQHNNDGSNGNSKFALDNYDCSLFASTAPTMPGHDVCLNLKNKDMCLHTLHDQWHEQQNLLYADGAFQSQVLPTKPPYRQHDEVGKLEKVNRRFRVSESTAKDEVIVAPRARFVGELDKLCRSHSFQMLGFKEGEFDFSSDSDWDNEAMLDE